MTTCAVLITLLAVAAAVIGSTIPQHEYSSAVENPYLSQFHARVARGAGRGPHKQCCGTSQPDLSEEEADMKACFEEYGLKKPEGGKPKGEKPPGPPHMDEEHMKKHGCALQCLCVKKEWCDSDGSIKEDVWVAAVESKFAAEPALQAIAEEAAKKCASDAKEMSKEKGTYDVDGKTCSAEFGMAMMCTHRRIEMNCPADLQSQDPHCVKMRQHMAEKGN